MSSETQVNTAELQAIRDDDSRWSDGYVAADPSGLVAQRRTMLALYDAQTKELEAARTRIADLERECDGQRRNSSELFDECKRRGLKMEQLRAQGLSQEDREACEYGAYCIEKHTGLSEHLQAAILRRLGGQP